MIFRYATLSRNLQYSTPGGMQRRKETLTIEKRCKNQIFFYEQHFIQLFCCLNKILISPPQAPALDSGKSGYILAFWFT